MAKKILLLIWVVGLLCAKIALASAIITEIMYNPSGTDSGYEWIEIYNDDQAIDLDGWRFYESGTNHGLELILGSNILNENQYAVIADDHEKFLTKYPEFNSTLLDSTFSLSNTGETIELRNSSLETVDYVDYNSSIGGSDNGNTISLINGSWIEGSATPGKENNIVQEAEAKQDIMIEVNLDDIIYANLEYTKLFKITNLNPEFGLVYNVTVNYNISKDSELIKDDFFVLDEVNHYSTANTGSFITEIVGRYVVCGNIVYSTANDTNATNDESCKEIEVTSVSDIACNISINISTDKFLYIDNETISFYNNLNNETYPYIIEYWIEDLFGNIVKKNVNTTNTDKKSYSPNIYENDIVLLIRSNVYPFCNDSNASDNSAEEMVIVKKDIYSVSLGASGNNESTIEIEDLTGLSNDKAKFGQVVNVKTRIYKGDTSKNVVDCWIESNGGKKVSKVSKANFYDKYTEYTISIPVQMLPNCDYDYSDGTYNVVVEGLGIRQTTKIKIEDITSSLCEEKIVYETKTEKGSSTNTGKTKNKGIEYELIEFQSLATSNREYVVQLNIVNNDAEVHMLELWSYVYRGSTSYSGEREENKIKITLDENSAQTITLKNKIDDVESGDYKLKIKMIEDNKKTAKEITEDIKIVKEEKETESLLSGKTESSSILQAKKENIIRSEVVYESTNVKLNKLVPWFIIGLLTLICVVLIWGKQVS